MPLSREILVLYYDTRINKFQVKDNVTYKRNTFYFLYSYLVIYNIYY